MGLDNDIRPEVNLPFDDGVIPNPSSIARNGGLTSASFGVYHDIGQREWVVVDGAQDHERIFSRLACSFLSPPNTTGFHTKLDKERVSPVF